MQPEGAALSFVRQRPGRLAGLTATLGGYVLAERARAGDARAWALQVGSRWRLGDGEQLRAVVGYLGVGERQSAALIGDNAGNATLDRDGDGRADAFRSAYGVLRPFVAFEGEGRIPVTLTVEGFWNARARSAARSGWLLGAALGHGSRPGRVRLEYQRHALEQDAIFTPVAADDFLRRTAQRGHYLGAQYRVSRRFDLHLTGFAAKPLAGDRATAWRWRLDLNASY